MISALIVAWCLWIFNGLWQDVAALQKQVKALQPGWDPNDPDGVGGGS